MTTIPISRYEFKRRTTKNGTFLYSKKNNALKRNVFYFSNLENQENINNLFEIFELECEQLKFIN